MMQPFLNYFYICLSLCSYDIISTSMNKFLTNHFVWFESFKHGMISNVKKISTQTMLILRRSMRGHVEILLVSVSIPEKVPLSLNTVVPNHHGY